MVHTVGLSLKLVKNVDIQSSVSTVSVRDYKNEA